MNTWRIEVTTLNHLWQVAYPRIVGHAWLNQNDYKSNFRDGTEDDINDFLRREFRLMGVMIDENIRVRVFDSDEPNFTLSIDGILTLPNPTLLIPDEAKDIYSAYATQNSIIRGGQIAFPGIPKCISPGSQITGGINGTNKSIVYLGERYRRTINLAPFLLAQVWVRNLGSSEERENEYVEALDQAEVGLPDKMEPTVKEGNLDYYIEGNSEVWNFHFPMVKPPDLQEYFRLFASGEAANPLFTGTV